MLFHSPTDKHEHTIMPVTETQANWELIFLSGLMIFWAFCMIAFAQICLQTYTLHVRVITLKLYHLSSHQLLKIIHSLLDSVYWRVREKRSECDSWVEKERINAGNGWLSLSTMAKNLTINSVYNLISFYVVFLNRNWNLPFKISSRILRFTLRKQFFFQSSGGGVKTNGQ